MLFVNKKHDFVDSPVFIIKDTAFETSCKCSIKSVVPTKLDFPVKWLALILFGKVATTGTNGWIVFDCYLLIFSRYQYRQEIQWCRLSILLWMHRSLKVEQDCEWRKEKAILSRKNGCCSGWYSNSAFVCRYFVSWWWHDVSIRL